MSTAEGGLRGNTQCHRVLLFLYLYQDFRVLQDRDQDRRLEALKNTFWRFLEMTLDQGWFDRLDCRLQKVASTRRVSFPCSGAPGRLR
jgi:hypothetical protein